MSPERAGLSVMLMVKDMPASVTFYRDRLGFVMEESVPDDHQPSWCRLALEGQSVMLGVIPEAGAIESRQDVSAEEKALHRKRAEAFRENKSGVGVTLYLLVADVDELCDDLRRRGVVVDEPTTRIYGSRELPVVDPDGYQLTFFTPVTLPACQSCGMLLSDPGPGEVYCRHCTNEGGQLRSFDQVFEGTVTGYFMAMHKLPRNEAERAAREHLRKMPAWSGF